MAQTDRLLRTLIAFAWLAATAAVWWPAPARAARLKEVASVQGVRSNPLVGYGLVVGLDGTGDQTTSTPFTVQSLNAMLQQMGVTVPPGTNMQLKNVAAVMVTAQLPAFAQRNLIVGRAGASQGGSKVQINHLSAGRVPEGATVERAVATPLNQGSI